jgi:cell division protein FtsA
MFDNSNLVVGLEIGTYKVCAVVGELGADGALNIVGLGQAPASGVRKGEIVDATQAAEAVRHAIVEAEKMANVEIRSVYLGVTGAHIRGFNNRGLHRLHASDGGHPGRRLVNEEIEDVVTGREVTPEDVEDVVKNAKAINLPAENSIMHAVRQHFYLDGQDGIIDPVGMLGALLEVDVHVVHGVTNRLHNAVRLVRGLHLEVDEIVFNGLASALALLTNDQKDLGALVIDLGGGTTDYVVHVNGIVKHTGVLAVGGDHVSNDLGRGLKVTMRRAEKLKCEHGSAIVAENSRDRIIALTNDLNLPVRNLNLEHLQRIMSLRLEEIFQIIAQDLEQAELLDHLQAGVFLCGGGARIPHIAQLAGSVFHLPVALGQTNSVSGLKSTLNQPEFFTAIGLVKYASLKNRRRPAPRFLPGLPGLPALKDILYRYLPLF